MKIPAGFKISLLAAAILGGTTLSRAQPSALPSELQQIRTVFVIGMENHNFTQPPGITTPGQLLGNPAAPYLNALLTPGNAAAAQVSCAARYYNAGAGVHPSEPNHVWAEAGTDFGVDTDNDPSAAAGNLFTAPHLTAQLNAAAIPWCNYEENVSLSPDPALSAAGVSTTVTNPYYATGDYAYAAKHNPMAFFTDTAEQNVRDLGALPGDLTNNVVGCYNWIAPNPYNDAHSALPGGFSYQGSLYTGDQAAIAQGDNFLATLIPQIVASAAYTNNGVIVIWWDETEGGDSTNFSLPEIVISPLARGNAYVSPVELNHSSDLKTWEEVFGLAYLTNSIPTNHPNVEDTGYNNVASVNDLADLFQRVSICPGTALHSDGFHFRFTGVVGQSYTVLVSETVNTPLTQWQAVAAGIFSTNCVLFTDTNAGRHSQSYYLVEANPESPSAEGMAISRGPLCPPSTPAANR